MEVKTKIKNNSFISKKSVLQDEYCDKKQLS